MMCASPSGPPTKGEALTAATAQGFEGDKAKIQHRQFTQQGETPQDETDHFERLQSGFSRRGWALYRLLDGASLACNSERGLQMPCPDNRAAASLLRILGGAD